VDRREVEAIALSMTEAPTGTPARVTTRCYRHIPRPAGPFSLVFRLLTIE
jgi:hypothetical protein